VSDLPSLDGKAETVARRLEAYAYSGKPETRAEQEVYNSAKELGRQIAFLDPKIFKQITGKNAAGAYVDGIIYVNRGHKGSKAYVFAHELTHSIEKAESYQKFVDVVTASKSFADFLSGKTLEEKIAETQNRYAKSGVTLNEQDALHEVVADYTAAKLLTDEKAIREMAETEPSLARRILQWIEELLAKIGVYEDESQFLLHVKALYRQALAETESDFSYSGQGEFKFLPNGRPQKLTEAEKAIFDSVFGTNFAQLAQSKPSAQATQNAAASDVPVLSGTT